MIVRGLVDSSGKQRKQLFRRGTSTIPVSDASRLGIPAVSRRVKDDVGEREQVRDPGEEEGLSD